MGQHSCWPASGALAPETLSSRGWVGLFDDPPPRERPLTLHCPFRKSLSPPAPPRRSHTRGGTGVTVKCEVRGQAPPALLLGPESGSSGRQGPGPTLTGVSPRGDWAQKKATGSPVTCSISSGAQGGAHSPEGPRALSPLRSAHRDQDRPGRVWGCKKLESKPLCAPFYKWRN